jgi:hypothetical protein
MGENPITWGEAWKLALAALTVIAPLCAWMHKMYVQVSLIAERLGELRDHHHNLELEIKDIANRKRELRERVIILEQRFKNA